MAHKTVADALGVSPLTVANHLDLLEQANLVYKLPPLDVGGKKVLKARNKYYLADAALRNAVLLRGEEVLTSPDEMGTIVETTVLRHLYAYYYRDTPTIAYWRDIKTDKEVDIIVKSPQYVLPVEVKYREQAEVEASSGLVDGPCLRNTPGCDTYGKIVDATLPATTPSCCVMTKTRC